MEQHIDFLLRRDWFLDEQGISDLLWTADEDTYNKILEKKNEYSLRVQWVLSPAHVLSRFSNVTKWKIDSS